MKETRKLFILTGNEQDVETVLNSITFKAITVLTNDMLSVERICEVFANNKSVVCTQIIEIIENPIIINVINNISSCHREDCIRRHR